jgi:hypothetical protein
MSAIINKQTNNVYVGHLKATADTVNGAFVKPNYAAGTATATASTAEGDGLGLLFVYNQNTKIDEEVVADSAFKVVNGEYLRAKALQIGEVVTTDQYTGTLAVDAIVAVGVGGKLEAIGVRTPVLRLQVIETTTIYGVAAVKAVVIAA